MFLISSFVHCCSYFWKLIVNMDIRYQVDDTTTSNVSKKVDGSYVENWPMSYFINQRATNSDSLRMMWLFFCTVVERQPIMKIIRRLENHSQTKLNGRVYDRGDSQPVFICQKSTFGESMVSECVSTKSTNFSKWV